MTKNDIVLEITNDSAYIDYCKKVCSGKDIYKDLFQYVVLYLLEMDEKKLLDIYSRGKIRAYIVRVIYSNIHYDTTPFMISLNGQVRFDDLEKAHNQVPEELEQDPLDESLNRFDEEMDRECSACLQTGVYPFDVLLYREYEKHDCSYTKLAKCTRIPYKTVQRHVHSIREKVIKKVNEDTDSNPA